MVGHPKLLPLAATVGDVRRFFDDEHVHAALIVTSAGCLDTVVERCDISGSLAPDQARASPFGRLAGRVVLPEGGLRTTWLAGNSHDLNEATTEGSHQRRRPACRLAVSQGQPRGLLLR